MSSERAASTSLSSHALISFVLPVASKASSASAADGQAPDMPTNHTPREGVTAGTTIVRPHSARRAASKQNRRRRTRPSERGMFEGDASQVVQLKAIVRWTDVVYLDMLRKYTLIRDDMVDR